MTFRPSPKIVRKVDQDELNYVVKRRDGICMWGLEHPGLYGACSAGLDPHHIIPRSVGGPDDRKHVITLCRHHHNQAEAHVIKPEELYAILERRFGYQYG
jgi:hypothetical protein